MKRLFGNLCGLGCLLSLVLAGAEMTDGSCSLSWTIGWLTASALLGWLFGKLTKTASHV